MNIPDFLTRSNGDIRLAGHRIGLYHVVVDFKDGDSAEMIASRYPTLPLSLVYKVIGYYLENQREVDAYVAGYSRDLEEQRQTGRRVELDSLRRRLQAREKTAATEPKAG